MFKRLSKDCATLKIHFVDIEIVFFKVFLRKIISTISNSSYTSQIHCRNALRLDPVIMGNTEVTVYVIFPKRYIKQTHITSCYSNCFSVAIPRNSGRIIVNYSELLK